MRSSMNLEEKLKNATKRVKTFEFIPDTYLIGRFKEIREIIVKGRKREMIIIEDEKTGEDVGIWSTTVLLSTLMEMGVKEGDRIGIKYLGKPEGKNYHDWIVIKDNEEGSS